MTGLDGGPDRDTALPGLRPDQRLLVQRWLPGAHVVADLSWGLIDSTVLRVRTPGIAEDVIVKACGPGNHHFSRESDAYRHWVGPLRHLGAAPVLHHVDDDARVLVAEFLPGELVQGNDSEQQPQTYRQAGALLAAFHDQDRRIDTDLGIEFNTARKQRALRWLAGEHRIPSATVRRLRALLADHPTEAVRLVPTHGDYQPRNWMVHAGKLAVIDFGRAEWRPAQTDLARLAVQQFRTRGDLERAFIEGYGSDPRGPDWRFILLTEAIATAAWAYSVGDEAFEAQGHRMIDDALALFPRR